MMVSCVLRRCQIKKHVDSFISLSHTVEKKQSKQQTCNLLIKMCVALVHKNQLLSVCLLHPVSRKKCFLSVLHLFKKKQSFSLHRLLEYLSWSLAALSPFLHCLCHLGFHLTLICAVVLWCLCISFCFQILLMVKTTPFI